VRYFLLREIPALGDGDFTYGKFEKRYNSDLASGLGNLFARTIAMIEKVELNNDFEIKPNKVFVDKVEEIKNKFKDKYIYFNETLSDIWELVSFCDKYIDTEKPWEVSDVKKQKQIFSNLIYSLKNISQMILPLLPETSEKMIKQLGEKDGKFNVKKGESLFPRI